MSNPSIQQVCSLLSTWVLEGTDESRHLLADILLDMGCEAAAAQLQQGKVMLYLAHFHGLFMDDDVDERAIDELSFWTYGEMLAFANGYETAAQYVDVGKFLTDDRHKAEKRLHQLGEQDGNMG